MSDLDTDRLDLDAIEGEFLQQCGSCDAGLPMGCACPTRDYRGTMSNLVTEVRRLRAREDRVRSLALKWDADFNKMNAQGWYGDAILSILDRM